MAWFKMKQEGRKVNLTDLSGVSLVPLPVTHIKPATCYRLVPHSTPFQLHLLPLASALHCLCSRQISAASLVPAAQRMGPALCLPLQGRRWGQGHQW